MQVVVFEDAGCRDLFPLTLARPTFEVRCGCDTLIDKIAATAGATELRFAVRPRLHDTVRVRRAWAATPRETQLWINGRFLLRALPDLACPSAAWQGDTLIAAHLDAAQAARLTPQTLLNPAELRKALAAVAAAASRDAWGTLIRYPWDLIAANAEELRRQIGAMPSLHAGRVDAGAHLLNAEAIHIGPGSRIKPTAVLDAEDGPIHIGANVLISPHVCIRGPCSIGDGSVIQPGASIREGTSIGPVCKVGGEVEGSILQGCANKQHDGFLGHSYVGEWVNLGADTVTSDLKNTYGNVSVPLHGQPIDTGLRFVGAIIGDHSKTAICTRLTTGTVIGFCCNIAAGRPGRHVPSFTWLTDEGTQRYDVDKALAVARTVMSRRKVQMTAAMEAVFRAVAAESPEC